MEQKFRPLYWVLTALIVIAMLVIALRPLRTETEQLPPLDIPEPGEVAPGEGIVIARIRTGGTSIFGFEFGSFDHQLDVQFYAPQGCSDTLSGGDPWPTGSPVCETDVDISGEVAGLGTTATGESIVSVLVDVSAECYDATERGASWPLTAVACVGPVY